MNRHIFFASFLAFNLSFSSGWSEPELESESLGFQVITDTSNSPFNFEAKIDAIGKAKVKKKAFEGDTVSFAVGQDILSGIVYHDTAHSEAVSLGLGYTATYLHWHGDPCENQNHFSTLSVLFSGFTARLDRWFWRTQLSINLDTYEWSSAYTNYDLILWGRYEFLKNIGIHFGFWAQTGMRMDRVYPIFGADWQICPKWKLNLVYPVNISLEYTLSKSWAFALAGRAFDSRQRLRKKSCQSKSLIHYQNMGAELAVLFNRQGLEANVHLGTTLGGRYRFADKHNHHAKNLHLKPAAYAGGEIEVDF